MNWHRVFALFLLCFTGCLAEPKPEPEHGYVIDGNVVRFAGIPIDGADAATFEWLGDEEEKLPWGRDQYRGYYRNLPVPDSDGPTFEAFSQLALMAKDSKHVYYGGYAHYQDPWFTTGYERWKLNMTKPATGVSIIEEADAQSFRFFKHNWFVDDYHLFHCRSLIKHIDPNTFRPLEEGKAGASDFWVDENHVYHGMLKIQHADPKSFRRDEVTGDWVDDRFVYRHIYRFEGQVNGQTVAASSKSWTLCGSKFYRTDGRLVFTRSGKLLPDSDPASFVVLAHGFAKDKENVYHNGRLIHAVDARTLEIGADGIASDIDGELGERDPRHN